MDETARVVGRTEERSRVTAALDAVARGGAGAVVAVTGPAGVGRTAFVRSLQPVAAERAVPFYYGSCPAGDDLRPLGGLEGIVGELCRDERVGRQADAVLTGRGLPLPGSGRLGTGSPAAEATLLERVTLDARRRNRLSLFDGTVRVLESAAGGRPMVLVLDDMQRADECLAEFLEYLVYDLVTMPILLVLVWDVGVDDGGGRDRLLNLARGAGAVVTEVELAPLGADALAEILDGRYPGHRFTDDFVRVIFTECAGVPRVLEELCTTLELQRVIHKGGTDWYNGPWNELAPGEGLEGSVYRRLGKLGEEDIDLLEFLAGLPPRFPQALLGTPEVSDYLGIHERALLKRLCKLAEPFRIFGLDGRDVVHRQPFLRDAILGDIPPHVVARDAEIVARGLERLHGAEPCAATGTIAQAYSRAGADDAALRHILAAVEYLDAYGASAAAVRYLLQSLAGLRHRVQDQGTMERVVEVQVRLAEHYQLQGLAAEAVDYLERALPLLGAMGARARRGVIELRIAANRLAQGMVEDGEAILADRLGNTEAEAEERVVAALLLARSLAARGENDRAMETLKEGAPLTDGIGGDPAPYVARLLVATGALWVERGEQGKARAVFEQALEAAPPGGIARVDALCQLAELDFRQGRPDVTGQRVMEALSEAERLSYLPGRARATEIMASMEESTNPDECLRLLHRAYGFLTKARDQGGLQRVAGRLGTMYRAMDDTARATFFLERSYRILQTLGRRDGQVQTGLVLGELVLKQNKLYEAERLFAEAGRLAGEAGNKTGEAFAAFGLGKVYLAQRKADRGRERLERARAVFAELNLSERVEMVDKELRLLTI